MCLPDDEMVTIAEPFMKSNTDLTVMYHYRHYVQKL